MSVSARAHEYFPVRRLYVLQDGLPMRVLPADILRNAPKPVRPKAQGSVRLLAGIACAVGDPSGEGPFARVWGCGSAVALFPEGAPEWEGEVFCAPLRPLFRTPDPEGSGIWVRRNGLLTLVSSLNEAPSVAQALERSDIRTGDVLLALVPAGTFAELGEIDAGTEGAGSVLLR